MQSPERQWVHKTESDYQGRIPSGKEVLPCGFLLWQNRLSGSSRDSGMYRPKVLFVNDKWNSVERFATHGMAVDGTPLWIIV